MEEKIYQIAGKDFKLKKFENYTHNEELKINTLLGISEDNSALNLNTPDNNKVFPLLLEAVDEKVDITNYDFNDMKNTQVYEVMVDWIASRLFFIQNMPNYLSKLLQKKMLLIMNTDPSMEKPENTLQG